LKLCTLPWRPLLVIGGLLLCFAGNVGAAPRVVATIQPLHSLAAGLMAGVGAPALLIEGAGSPHNYALRPSDARLLAEAELVLRVGADFETFLNRALVNLTGRARVLDLDQLPGILLLPARTGGLWEGEPAGKHARGHDHQPAENNLHLWLDPQNARTIVAATAKALREIDPANGERYRANAATLDARLARLDRELQQQLAPVAGIPYFVFHDAYPYLEQRYGLHPAGAITVSPERPPGARRVAEIRQRVQRQGARCVFSEPQFQPKLAAMLIEGTGARRGVLDPLGAELPAGPEAYFLLMRKLAASLLDCLQPAP
jgi:zinc transport system substrate-binding protein